MAETGSDKRTDAQKQLLEAAELLTPEMLLAQLKVGISKSIKQGSIAGMDRL